MNFTQPLNEITSFTVEFSTALIAGLLPIALLSIVTIAFALSRAL